MSREKKKSGILPREIKKRRRAGPTPVGALAFYYQVPHSACGADWNTNS